MATATAATSRTCRAAPPWRSVRPSGQVLCNRHARAPRSTSGAGGGCALRACAAGAEPTRLLRGFVGWAAYPLTCAPAPPAPAPWPPPPSPPPPAVYGFRFATTHTDGMVLQAAPQASIVWGFSSGGGPVRVCVGADKCVDAALAPGPSSAGADTKIFTATLPVMPPSSTPYNISAASAGTTILLQDVLFGDVYVCSGQSNMVGSCSCSVCVCAASCSQLGRALRSLLSFYARTLQCRWPSTRRRRAMRRRRKLPRHPTVHGAEV